ncbi:MAG: outer membrane protein transport protein [Pseudomonadales bacterium]|nr:outer membrane protein transport protein [Halioglobus sp.]MCP5194609.1 outer membrane protein transport protein [Pseudomonadales bacterium]
MAGISFTGRLSACVVLLAGSAGAWANGPGFSGLIAEADTAESAFACPAGMSRLEGTRTTLQGMGVTSQSSFNVDESRTNIDGGNPDKGAQPVVIPAAYYVRQLDDRWHAGLSLSVPTGFGSNYGSTWAGRYQTVDFSLVYVSLSPAMSYRVNDKLSVGLGANINYTSESSEQKIRQPFSETDGKLTSDLSGVGVSLNLSMLYEFSPRTRAGVAWTSDSDADMEGNVRLRKLEPRFDEIVTDLGVKNINTKVTNTLPQRVMAGIYHQFDSGKFVTLDGMWMKFSDFTISNLELNGTDVNISQPDIYNNIWAVTAGAGFPVDDRLTYKVGAAYLSQPVDDEDRTLAMRLDAMWVVGVGLTYELMEGRSLDVNANYINLGEAPVDSTKGLLDRQHIVGESTDPYAIMLELAYHF